MIVASDGRKHPVHWPVREAFNTPVIIFLTVVTKNRKPILANDAAHTTLTEAWKCAKKWVVGRYIVMPDHVRLFCAPGIQVPEPLRVEDWPYQGELNDLRW